MPLNLNQLTPYLSVIVLKISNDSFNINSLFENLALNARNIQISTHSSGAIIYFKNYVENKKVSWTDDNNIVDRINHLMIVFKIDNYLAIYHSDNSKKNFIYKFIFRGNLEHEFKKLRLIRKEVLNAAFINNVKVKNLWLNNIDKSSDLKADSKVLSGKNLEEALDPLGDSNYTFSALKVEMGDESIGINTSDSKVWTKKYSDSDEYFDSLEILLNSIKDCDINNNLNFDPIRTLSNSHNDITQLNSIIDIQLSNIESFDPQSDEYNLLNNIVHLWDNWNFIYTKVGDTFIIEIFDGTINNNEIARLGIRLFDNLEIIIVKAIISSEIEDTYNLQKVFENKNIIKFWFDNNYSLINGSIFKQKFRDVSFNKFKWTNFPNIDVSKEKPTSLSLIGQEDSLFCWVKKYWRGEENNLVDITQQFVRGWLLCDDGSNEKADFIHISNETIPTISFIHAKGANSNTNSRNLSTTAYEVVISQAIKNLRYVDKNLLSETIDISPNNNVANLVWLNGNQETRINFKNHLNSLTTYKKRVVVLQPHLIRYKFENYNNTPTNRNRINQLNTLFVSTQITIQSLGAEFVVIGDDL
ncbi:MAG: hypothetical protein PHY66_05840 [Aliarcobacter sp.]|nr:hypothetical protein [Aliarcobacter sp.]